MVGRILGFLVFALATLTACNAVLGLDEPTLGVQGTRDHCVVAVPAERSGCNANETCQIANDQAGTRTCVLAGNSASGAECTADTDCASGLTCDTTDTRTCVRYCTGEDDSSCSGKCRQAQVSVEGEDAPVDIPGRKLCFVSCNPLKKECNGSNCEYFDAVKRFTCSKAGPGRQGDICEAVFDCDIGFSCTTVANVASCKERCIVGGPCQATGTECAPFKDKQIVDGTEFGACVGCIAIPQAQSGCANDETCAFTDGTTTRYAPTCVKAGSLPIGAACTNDTDCQKGLQCYEVCTEFCPEPKEGPAVCEGRECFQVKINDKPLPGAFLCRQSCDPVTSAECPNAKCYVLGDNVTDCGQTAKDPKQAGEGCSENTGCVAGTFCGETKVCQRWCRGIGTQDNCDSGQKCVGVGLHLKGVELGGCQ